MSVRVVRGDASRGGKAWAGGRWRSSRRLEAAVATLALLGAAAASPWLAGCASGHSTKTRTAADAKEVPAPVAKDSGTSAKHQPTDLAEQARRDMEAWRKLRSKEAQPDSAAARGPAPQPTGAAAPAGPTPPAVVWNDGHGEAPQSAPATRVVKTALPSQPPPQRPTTPPPAPAAEPPAAPVKHIAEPVPSTGPVASPTNAANTQPAQSDTERLQNLLVELSRELYRQAADSDMPMRQLLLIAATTIVNPDRAIDANVMPGLTERERQLLASLQGFFADLGKELAKSGDPEVIPAAIERLRKIIRTDPQLRLANASLCSNVEGFGKFRSFDPRRFLAHSEQQVIVYVEVDKFTSETNSKGEFVTELSQQLVIYSDRDGIPVWQEDWQTATDVTRNKRTDFFMRQIVTIPKALSVGQYQMKIRVRDNKSRAEAETSVPFEMVADPKMAAGAAR